MGIKLCLDRVGMVELMMFGPISMTVPIVMIENID